MPFHQEKIVSDLPDWPAELCLYWLVPESEGKGWPPDGSNDWRYIFGVGRTLSHLKKLQWRKEKRELSFHDLAAKSQCLIIDMFRGYYWRDPAASAFVDFDGGRERFNNLTSYILQHGFYPWPPALERGPSGLEILDGFHRCLSVFYLSGLLKVKTDDINVTCQKYVFEYWIAESQ